MDLQEFRQRMEVDGYAFFPGLVPPAMLARFQADIPVHFARCSAIQQRNGVGAGMAAVAHHVLGGHDSLDDFAAALFLDDHLREYFAGEYILNSFGAVDNLPQTEQRYEHGHRFHRDVRTWSGRFRLMVNMLVMVDDFTQANGATCIVPGSHLAEARPSDDDLARRGVQVTGTAGGVVLFDSNLWHSAMPNLTPSPRKALTLTFTRPFVKQQMDYPRLLGEDFTDAPRLRQVLGYNARVPVDHDQWYQPPEKRMYRPGQG